MEYEVTVKRITKVKTQDETYYQVHLVNKNDGIKLTIRVDEKDWDGFAKEYNIRINAKLMVFIEMVQQRLSDFGGK